MSSVMTITQTSVADPNLSLWKEAIDELPKISDQFKTYVDPLSLKMQKWIVKVCAEAPGMIKDPSSIHMQALKKVDDLAKNILVCSKDSGLTPLQDPLIDQEGNTWEKKNLQMYLGFTALSSNGSKMEVTGHVFAKAMIDWVGKTPYPSSTPSTALVAIGPEHDMMKMMLFGEMAKRASLAQAFGMMTQRCKTVQDLCVQKEEKIKKACASEIERLAEQEKQRAVQLNTKVDAMGRMFADTLSLQQGKVDAANRHVDTLDARLLSTESRLERSEINLKYSQSELDAAKQRIEELNRIIEELEDDSGCVLA